MFIGHFGVALAAKRVAPRVSLGTSMLASQFLDVLWPVFIASRLEHVRIVPGYLAASPLQFLDYPYTHSLAAAAFWAVLFAAIHFAVKRHAKTSLILAAVVFSHWILDWITHTKDLALYPDSHTFIGLGLWNSVAGTLIVEVPLFAIGV